MNTIKGIIILVAGGLILYLLLSFDFWVCPFRSIFHIHCPACGMTRAFRSLLELNLIDAIRFNLLSVPLVPILTYFLLLLIYTIIKNSDLFFRKIDYILSKYYRLIIIILIVNMIINNIKQINIL